jgi:hypothetical protein
VGMTLLWVLAGLQVKHFVADYMLQTPAMIKDKCHLTRPGGYVHAGIHVAGTLLVLLLAAVPVGLLWKILLGEFVVHYTTDYIKAFYGSTRRPDMSSGTFWMAHGLDQLVHHLTYTVILAIVFLNMTNSGQ